VSWKRAPLLTLRYLIVRGWLKFHLSRADHHDDRAEAYLKQADELADRLRQVVEGDGE
jgi:cell division inhibitor SulA